jgi:hypothetical protein
LDVPDNAPVDDRQRLDAILEYYSDRAQQPWQPLDP